MFYEMLMTDIVCLTVNTLLCSAEERVECRGRTLRLSRVTPVAAISFDFFKSSVMSRMLARPGTNINIAPACVSACGGERGV